MTRRQLREILGSTAHPQWAYYAGKILREFRPDRVWSYLSPQEVADRWPDLRRYLGRSRPLWSLLFAKWIEFGYVRSSAPIA